MCAPAVLGLVGAVVSAGMSMMVAQQQAAQQQAMIDAQNQANKQAAAISARAREAEQVRQKAFEATSNENWNETLDSMSAENSEQSTDEATEEFVEEADAMGGVINEGQLLSGQQFASEAVQDQIGYKTAEAAASARKRVAALAALTGYGQTDQKRAMGLNNNADKLTITNNLRRGSLAVADQEQNISPGLVGYGGGGGGSIGLGLAGALASAGSTAAGYKSTING